MPIHHTETAATGSSRRAFLARTAAGGAVAASVGAIGLNGGLGVLPALAQEGGEGPTAIKAKLSASDFATLVAPLELAATQAYLSAITNGRTELSDEWLDHLSQFLRHHQEVATLLVSMIQEAEVAPTADPGITAQYSPQLGSDQNAILGRLGELEAGLAATHLAVIGDLEDEVTAKTVIQVSATEQQQAVALSRAAGVSIEDLTPAVASIEGALVAGGTPATPFGGEESTTTEAVSSESEGEGEGDLTTTTEADEESTTSTTESTDSGN